MMLRWLRILALISIIACSFSAMSADPVRSKPRALLLQQSASGDHRMTLFALKEAGFETTWINKDSIADFPASAEALRERFDVVFFGGLAREGGIGKLLSPDQFEALKQFVEQGGGLVAVIAEGGPALWELLPVTPGPGAGQMVFRPAVVMAEHPILTGLPAEWPLFGSKWNSFSKVAAKPGADVVMEVPTRYSDKAYPFLIASKHGGGRVVCLNSLWASSTGLNFKRWEWAPAFFMQCGRWAAGLDPVPASKVKPIADRLWFWSYEREAIPGAAEHVNSPILTPVGPPPPGRAQIRLGFPKETGARPAGVPPELQDSDGMLVARFGNGIVARIDKRGMVGYRTEDGLVLAKDPVDETPQILYSGEAEAVITNADGGEFAVLKEALPEPGARRQSFRYVRHAIVEDALDVTFQVFVDDQPEGELVWSFRPRTMAVEGVEWRGIGERFLLTSPRLFVEHILPRHQWAIGGEVDGHFTFRTACYGQPRGYHMARFTDQTSQDAGHFRWFSSGQPFQMMGSPHGTLWYYAETPALVASWLANTAGSGHIRMVNKIGVGRLRGRIETPTLWYLFSTTPMDHNLWMASYDFLREKYRRDFGVKPMHPRPTAMMRFQIMGFVELRRYADTLIPLAKRLGFKRFDCGVRYVHDLFNPDHGGIEVLKYLCDRAHEAGMEVFFYCASAWAKDDFPPLKQHPEWIVRGRDGAPCATGYPNLYALSLRSGWWDYSLAKYKELKEKTGMDGVWLDSWTMPNEYVNYAQPDATPTVAEAMRYVKAIQDLGYTVWVEGQSPAALDSFWYRHDRYADLQGNEFCLFDTTPFAYAGNGLFYLDLFRLLSYNCAMFQDLRLLYQPEDKITQVASHCNHLMNEIHDAIGFPLRVREAPPDAPFGTTWECERGYAVFAHESRNMDVAVPEGEYSVKAVDTPNNFEMRKGRDGAAHIIGTLMARGVLVIKRQEP